MRWMAPEMLWLLLFLAPPVALYVWAWRRRKKQVLVFSTLRVLRAASATQSSWRRHLPAALIWIAMGLGLLSLARPSAVITLPSEQRKLVIAIDVSRSMLARDVEPSRIEAAQVAVRVFIKRLPNDLRAGVVTFAGTAQVVQGITESRDDLLRSVQHFDLQRATATGSGLLLAISLLRPDLKLDLETGLQAPGMIDWPEPRAPGSDSSGAVVLLSDGRRTTGPDPVSIAQRAADLGIRVHTVGFGTPTGTIPGYEGYSFFVRVDEETLKAVARITEGEYFYAGSAQDLMAVYRKLQGKLALETRQTELSFVLAGLMLLLSLIAIAIAWQGQRVLRQFAR
ncbi:MAG: VWA domain-containing protein [Quisquiliibacterium sp.]